MNLVVKLGKSEVKTMIKALLINVFAPVSENCVSFPLRSRCISSKCEPDKTVSLLPDA